MKIRIISILFFYFIVISCTVKLSLPKGEKVCAGLTQKNLWQLENQYPKSFQLTQRILLSVSGKEYDFIGSLTMRQDSVFRAVALGEMGGTFLDIKHETDTVSILKNSGNLPENPLLDGVVGDILYLFSFSRGNKKLASSFHNEQLHVQLSDSINETTILIFEKNNLIASEQIIDGQLVRKAQYSNYIKSVVSGCPLPGRILLENKKWRYTLKIDLLKIIQIPE